MGCDKFGGFEDLDLPPVIQGCNNVAGLHFGVGVLGIRRIISYDLDLHFSRGRLCAESSIRPKLHGAQHLEVQLTVAAPVLGMRDIPDMLSPFILT